MRNIGQYVSRLKKHFKSNIQETEQIPNRLNTKRYTPIHTIIELLKDKEKTMKAGENQNFIYYEQYN